MKKTDVIVVGTGVAGLFCALNLPREKKIVMLTKKAVDHSDSFLAQGGICTLKDEQDYDSFFEDTMKAGHNENRQSAVDVMIRTSPEIIRDMVSFGVEFDQKDGKFSYTREGAHSTARILHHKDLTGKEITSKLLAHVRKRDNITILEETTMIDLLCHENNCAGVVLCNPAGEVSALEGDYVVLASGGLGGLFEHSTNYRHLTGDAIAIALKHNIAVRNINYIQVHPTTFYSKKSGRRFLISESVRGEGALLYNGKMERFVDELLPRDVLTKEIRKQMKIEGSEHVWLSMAAMGSSMIKKRFPNIYRHCLEEGYDVTKEPIPVTPAQHYLMGGIEVDLNSKTSMNRLYAVGETSHNGVHGANRLASNSLLESLVFAKRAAGNIADAYQPLPELKSTVNWEGYDNLTQLQQEYKQLILDEIERENNV
ncbi:MAG: L-aspartate oxidase [Eubacteriales bacterium]|nr:L-aspartate oxidase [Eubacteriales bacterium]